MPLKDSQFPKILDTVHNLYLIIIIENTWQLPTVLLFPPNNY